MMIRITKEDRIEKGYSTISSNSLRGFPQMKIGRTSIKYVPCENQKKTL